MKNLRILLLVLLGITLGFAIRTNYELVSFDRAERMFEVFEKVCLATPQADPAELGLMPSEQDAEAERWIDSATKAMVTLNERSCRVGTFDKVNLSQSDVERWTEMAADAAKAFAPLEFDDKGVQNGDTYARGWMHGPLQSEERWGIYIFAFLPGDDEGSSILNFRAPQ